MAPAVTRPLVQQVPRRVGEEIYERVVSSQRWRAVQLAFRPLDRARRALRARRTSA